MSDQPLSVTATEAGRMVLDLIHENQTLNEIIGPRYHCWRGPDGLDHGIECPRWCFYGHGALGYALPPRNGWRMLPSQDPQRTTPPTIVPIP